jgi:ElaB/YqjD/DUF883 family membrane-anchored ribosome-binding protein
MSKSISVISEIDQLRCDVDKLQNVQSTLAQFGSDKTSIQLIKSLLLTSVSPIGDIGTESLSDEVVLESFGDTIKQKVGEWSARVLSVVKATKEKVISSLKPIWDKITQLTKKLTNGVWNTATAIKNQIKAHPYATIALVIVAMIAVVGLVGFVNRNTPSVGSDKSTMDRFISKLNEMINRIKSPLGSIKSNMKSDHLSVSILDHTDTHLAVGSSTNRLGYTKSAIATIQTKLNGLWNSLVSVVGVLGEKCSSFYSTILKKAGNDSSGSTFMNLQNADNTGPDHYWINNSSDIGSHTIEDITRRVSDIAIKGKVALRLESRVNGRPIRTKGNDLLLLLHLSGKDRANRHRIANLVSTVDITKSTSSQVSKITDEANTFVKAHGESLTDETKRWMTTELPKVVDRLKMKAKLKIFSKIAVGVTLVISVFWAMYKLISSVLVKGFEFILSNLRKLTHVVESV